MRSIGAAKFKEECLAILDNVDDEGIDITKRGKPVAKLIPIHAASGTLIGALEGRLTIEGDIETTGVDWNAQP